MCTYYIKVHIFMYSNVLIMYPPVGHKLHENMDV